MTPWRPIQALVNRDESRLPIEGPVNILQYQSYPAAVEQRITLDVGSRPVLYADLSVRVRAGRAGPQTLLDFSHTADWGCVLQFEELAGTRAGTLSWVCAGVSLSATVSTGQWIRIICGYDSKGRVTSLAVNGDVRLEAGLPHVPFANGKEITLAVGYWLEGSDRGFSGDMKNLKIADKPIDMAIAPSSNALNIDSSTDAPVSKLWRKIKRLASNSVANPIMMPVLSTVRAINKLGDSTVQFATSGDEVAVTLGGNIEQLPADAQKQITEFIAFVTREDAMGAAHHLNRLHDLDYRIRIAPVLPGIVDLSVTTEPSDIPALANELLAIDFQKLNGIAAWVVVAAMMSCAQTMYRREQREESAAFLTEHLKKAGSRSSHLLRDMEMAQSQDSKQGEAASVLAKNMARGGLEYLDFFEGSYCNNPFDEFEIRSDGEIFVCCPSYLPYSIGNVYSARSVDAIKSSKMQEKIKDSILRQDFRYCRWLHCGRIKNLPPLPAKPKTHYAPTIFRLSYDPTCNLWCPSCRTEKIVAKGEQRDQILRLTDSVVVPMLKEAHSCMMNGYGDVFASKACRRILEVANPDLFPNLKFDFITNGVLFTRDQWEAFPGIHQMVKSIRVSIDAAKKETYDQVRLGGDWDTLMENLEFMSTLRRDKSIECFMISMVVQDCNVDQMVDFARMGKRLGCDFVVFEPIMNWNTYTVEAFAKRAVHYDSHPRYRLFLDGIDQVAAVTPFVNSQLVKLLGTPGYETLASANFDVERLKKIRALQ